MLIIELNEFSLPLLTAAAQKKLSFQI